VKEQNSKLPEAYLDYLSLNERAVKNPKTVLRIYFPYLENLGLDCLSVRIADAQEFQHYLSTLTDSKGKPHYSVSSVSTMTGCLTAFYNYLKLKKLVLLNPFSEIRKIKQPKSLPGNIPGEEDMQKLLSSLRSFLKGENLTERRNLYKAHVIAELMYSTGARINEIVLLKLHDVDLIRGTVRIHDTKTNQVRDSILNSYTEKILRIFIEEMRDFVLFGKNGSSMDYLFGSLNHVRIVFNRVLGNESRLLELGTFKSHGIRHAVGVHLLNAGCDIRYIQEILGHRELTSTQVYTKVSKENLKGVLDRFHPRVFSRSLQ